MISNSGENEEHGTDEIRTLVALPDGALPTGVVEVVEFLSVEGRRQYAYRYRSDSPLSATVGLLGMVSFALQRDAETWETDDDGD